MYTLLHKKIKGKPYSIRHYRGFPKLFLENQALLGFHEAKTGVECGSWVNRHVPQAGMRVPKPISFATGESMALEAIAMEGPEARVSDQVTRLIATCSRGWERFFADHDDDQEPRFVPSVPERVWAVLAEVTRRQLPPTRVFCEWGSGFGTATCLAALLGY